MSNSTADDTAPTSTLSDGPPLDAAQRLGLARFRLGPDAPPWLTETLAFARDEVARLTRERGEARAAIAADLHCGECGAVATKRWVGPPDSGATHACDGCSDSPTAPARFWADLPHAAAVRAAQVTT